MIRIIFLILVLSRSAILFGQDVPTGFEREFEPEFKAGYWDGQAAAKRTYSGGGWYLAGAGSGLVGGPIGVGLLAGYSQTGIVEPPFSLIVKISDRSDEYKMSYIEGYSRAAKSERLELSILGGVVGTLALVTIVYLSQ